MIRINWDQMKILIDTHQVRARFVSTENGYEIHGADQGLVYACNVVEGEADHTEFENDYKTEIESMPVGSVSTKFEATFLVLKLAKVKGTADANGDLAVSIMVPGSIANIERYAAGGYAITNDYDFNDSIEKVEIIDRDGVTGLPAGTVLKTYHDDDVPTANRGWYFWKSHGTEGECEIEPIGWYGQLNGELELKITMKVKALAVVKCNIWWGKKE